MVLKNYFKTFLLSLLLPVLSCAATLDSYVKEGTDFTKYKKISVIKFDSVKDQSIGQEVADVISLEFLKKGYNIIERSQLKSLIDEEALRLSGLTESSKSALKILGVDAIITGSIARYVCVPSEIKYENISINTNNCQVALSLKMLDIQTGEVIWAANGSHASDSIQMTEHKVLQEIILKLYAQIPVKPANVTDNNQMSVIKTPKTSVINQSPIPVIVQLPVVTPAPVIVQTSVPTPIPVIVQISAPQTTEVTKNNEEDSHFAQANLYASQGKLIEAINEYKEVIKINLGHLDSYMKLAATQAKLGIEYYQQKKFDEAIFQYQESLKINPSNHETYNNLGVAYFALNKSELAVNAYKESIKLRSDFASAHDNLGLTYQVQGKIPEAIAEFKIACQLGMKVTCDWLKRQKL